MRIGVFDPYLDTKGGGEKYMLTLASCLSKEAEVNVFWNDPDILKTVGERFAIDTSQLHMAPDIFSMRSSFQTRRQVTQKYDAFFYLSDGSIPWLFSKKNILLLQFPVRWVKGKSLVNKLKLKNIHTVVANSQFVKEHIDKTYGVNSIVITPPVTPIPDSDKKKENIILTVGRFTRGMNMKKQKEMIAVFKKMCDKGVTKWRFVVAGGARPEDESFVDEILTEAKRYPIDIRTNISHQELVRCYQIAKIYWHATGFGEDIEKHPERTEHFGISTVEAMSAGCVPVVYAAGGQREIVNHEKDGFLWNTEEELMTHSKWLMEHRSEMEEFANKAREKAERYDEKKFCEAIRKLI